MPEVTHFAQLTRAALLHAAWDETYFALTALKGQLQSLPGFVGYEVLGRASDEVMNLLVIVRWTLEEQLEAWLALGETPFEVLQLMEPPPTQITVEYLLELA